MTYVLLVIHVTLILFLACSLAKRWNVQTNKLFWTSFVVHLMAGIFVGLVYKFYYSANDTWFFFESAAKVADIAKQDFFSYIKLLFDFSEIPNPVIETEDFRSMIFIKIISVFCFIGNNNYWISAAYFSFFSFVSSWFLHRKIIEIFPESSVASALAFLFFPSVVFWSSGLEKETLTLASLFLMSGIFLNIIYKRKTNAFFWLIIFFAGGVVWMLKYYWAAVFFMAVIAALLSRFLSEKYSKIKNNLAVTYFFLFLMIGVAASFLHPNFYLERFFYVVVTNHNDFVTISNDKNLIHYYQLQPTVISIIINSPWALTSGIFRPFPGEGQGILGFIASLENFFILILFIGFLLRLKQKKLNIGILFLTVLSYCLVLCIFLALSTPNLGTLSRYRVGFLPFLIFIFTYKNPVMDFITKKFRLRP